MMNTQHVREALNSAASAAGAQAGKYLTFRLGAEEYGLEILKVREIIGLMEITKVPKTPGYIRGVINLRGKVIPVLDLRLKFGMETKKYTDETCIIVVEVTSNDGSVQMGILVDAVSEVLDIQSANIEETPKFGGDINTDFILGMGKVKNDVKILLDIDKVLTATDIIMAERVDREYNEGDSVPTPTEAPAAAN